LKQEFEGEQHEGWKVTYAITIDTLIRPRLTKFKTEA
jgi:hypothetical protein